jgi:hypothetical protein
VPYQTTYEPEKQRIHIVWEGLVTPEEYQQIMREHDAFFDSATGAIGMISDLSRVQSLPSTVLAQSRNARWVKYRPLFVALIGVSSFVKMLVSVFNAFSGIGIQTFATLEEAEAWISEQLARANA